MPADPRREAFVARVLPLGQVTERQSRYADKPALWLGAREVAHSDEPGLIDLRITAAGWRSVSAAFVGDPAVIREKARRDWISLRLGRVA